MKKMKRKLLLFAMSIAMVGSLTACGGGKGNSGKGNAQEMKAEDRKAAIAIGTAIGTAMANEGYMNDIAYTHGNEVVKITESGLDVYDSATKKEIMASLKNIPSVSYKEDGAEFFSVIVTDTEVVKIYVGTSNEPTKWQLAPECDPEYK